MYTAVKFSPRFSPQIEDINPVAETALLNIQKFEVLNSVKFLSGDFHDF
jgi:hypothetical protein